MKLFSRKMNKKQKAALNALADGIECGAKLHPQTCGALVHESGYVDETITFKTCALGAALECAWVKEGKALTPGTLETFRRVEYDTIMQIYGVDNRKLEHRIVVEDCDGEKLTIDSDPDVVGLIWQLNDRANWKREQIAAFLRDLE